MPCFPITTFSDRLRQESRVRGETSIEIEEKMESRRALQRRDAMEGDCSVRTVHDRAPSGSKKIVDLDIRC